MDDLTSWSLSADALVRLVVAVAVGAAIGLEREANDQEAGLRTHMGVAMGAALFGVISTLGFSEFATIRADTNVSIDVTRVASQVVVGIGFLGAGIIFRDRFSIRNLTTAASLWATAAIGLAAGVGDPLVALIATVLLIAVLVFVPVPRRWLDTRVLRQTRRIHLVPIEGHAPEELRDAIEGTEGISIKSWVVLKTEGRLVVEARLGSTPRVDLDHVLGTIARWDSVHDLQRH